ncbi:hypothetical protein Tco_0704171 [Tanacetum coccineum]|uniref:PB1-like domain-containing protein n=1 Tax=Tanacetum coccineum TaxID=301880 RepID=A0ABQ4Y1W5_9ASTR
MFSIRIHHGGKFQRYLGRRYFNGHVDISDIVDINMFTVVALNLMVVQLGYAGESELLFINYLRPLTRLDEGFYALACKEDVRCLATLVRSFKLINDYIEHGVTAVDSYRRPPQQVIEDMIKQLSFKETKLDGEAGFADVVRNGKESFGLSHDESFGVDDLDLNLNEIMDLNVSQSETKSELPVSEEPDVGSTQEPIVEEVIVKDYVSSEEDVKHGNGQEDESAPSNEHFFYDDEGIYSAYETQYDVQSSEDVGTDDDDDNDDDFLVDEENEIIEPNVDVHLFGDNVIIWPLAQMAPFLLRKSSVDQSSLPRVGSLGKGLVGIKRCMGPGCSHRSTPFEEGDNVDLINEDGFDSDPSNDNETIGPSGSSGPTTRSKKRKNTGTNNDSQACSSALDAHDKGDLYPWVLEIKHCTYKFLSEKIFDQVRVNPEILVKAVQDKLQRDLELQISMSKAFRAKAKAEREIRGDHVLQYSMLRDYIIESITKEAYLMKAKWNGGNKYQVLGIPYKHVVAAYWNVALNDRAASPLEACVNPCYWLTTWRETYSHKVELINGTNYWEKSTCPTTLLPPKYHVKVGRPKKKRKRSKHKDEPFMKDGKLIGNNEKASGSASRQAQQAEPAVGQDGLGGLGVGAVIGLAVADCAGGAGVGVGSQGSSHTR